MIRFGVTVIVRESRAQNINLPVYSGMPSKLGQREIIFWNLKSVKPKFSLNAAEPEELRRSWWQCRAYIYVCMYVNKYVLGLVPYIWFMLGLIWRLAFCFET